MLISISEFCEKYGPCRSKIASFARRNPTFPEVKAWRNEKFIKGPACSMYDEKELYEWYVAYSAANPKHKSSLPAPNPFDTASALWFICGGRTPKITNGVGKLDL